MTNTIKSNNDFLKSNTDTILNTISSIDTAALSCHETYDSTTNCPTEEPPIVDTFLSACNELFEKIKSETNLIVDIGHGIAELDNVMKGKATTLDIELSSNLAKDVTPKEFENVEIPTQEDISSQINTAANEANIDLSSLELPHDAFDYGTIKNDNNNYEYYNPYNGDTLPENYYDYTEGPYGYEDNIETDIPHMVDGVYREIIPESNMKTSNNQESNNTITNPEEYVQKEIINPYSLSSKKYDKEIDNIVINTNTKNGSESSKNSLKNNSIISNLSQAIANTNIKVAEEVPESNTKAAGIISSLAGIGLSSGAVYGVKAYDKSRNKNNNTVKEYTIESYEKEKKDHGYYI